MLRVLIADDEPLIRKGLKEAIDWKTLGMEVVGLAEDGKQALDLISDLDPEVIVTDIFMPFLSGIEFIDKIRQEKNDAYVIIISGYDEFEHAQKAISLGVTDYILKPIDLEHFERVLVKIKDNHDSKKPEKDSSESNQSSPIHLNSALTQAIFTLSEQETTDLFFENSINMDQYCMSTVLELDGLDLIKTKLSDQTLEDYISEFIEQANQLLSGDHLNIIRDGISGRILLISTNELSEDFLESELKYRIYKLRNKMQSEGVYAFSTFSGRVYSTLVLLRASYLDALELIKYSYIYSGSDNRDVYYKDFNFCNPQLTFDLSSHISKFSGVLKTFDKDLIKKNLDQLKVEIKGTGANSLFFTQIIVGSYYSEILKLLCEFQHSEHELVGDPINVYKKIMDCNSLDDTIDELRRLLCKICDYMDQKESNIYFMIFEKAKLYINNNYTNPALSLGDVARYIGISPGYFSILFKQTLGETFIHYLTSLRLEKAKLLLQHTNMRSYEISFNVGYDNPTYFTTIFKKQFGITPREFRESHKNI